MSEVLEAPISESPAGAALDSFVSVDKPDLQSPGNERVKGEIPPDFSKLGKSEPSEPEEAPETTESTSEPKKETRARGEAPESKEKASTKAEDKPKAESKKPEAKKDESKDQKTEPELPDSDEDLDKIQPKPGAAPHVVKSIGDLKAGIKKSREVARQYKAQVEELENEIKSLKASVGKMTPELEQEVNGLRNFHTLFKAQDDPVFKKNFNEPIIQKEDGIYALLSKHGLKPEVLDEIKKTAAANGGDLETWAKWPALIEAFKNPLDKQTVLNALQDRRNAVAARNGQLEKLQKDRDGFYKDLSAKDQAEKDKWASDVAKAAEKDVTGEEWAMEKTVPAEATAEAKKLAEEHNARVTEYGKEWQKNVVAMHSRDPQTIAKLAFAAVRASHFQKENEKLAAAQEKAEDRIADLEAQLSKIKGVSRMARVETAAPETTKSKSTVEDGKIGGDGTKAFDSFFGGRR